jgi:hypothetical protein
LPLVVSNVLDWFSKTAARARSVVPNIVMLAFLDVASTFALVSVPVVRVINAVLDGADKAASGGVERVNNAVLCVWRLESADASASVCVVVVAFLLALSAGNEVAQFHVPGLAIGSWACGWDAAALS